MIGRLILEHHRPGETEGKFTDMKRDGYIIQEIIEQSNLEEAFDAVVRGTMRKQLREGRWLLEHREEFLQQVREEILSGNIVLGDYHEKIIREGGKTRHIQVFCMRGRVKINAVMAVVDKHLRRRYIRTTGASIKNRGMHDLMKYIRRDLLTNPNIRYWFKADVYHCYDTVMHHFVKFCLQRVFKDKLLLKILYDFIDIMPGGVRMSMGMRSSQGLVNLLLSVFIDHVLKDKECLKHFYRYMDDIVAGAATKRELWHVRDIAHKQVNSIGQRIKPNERVFPVESGLDFLGYQIFPTHTLLRKRVKKNFARKLARIKSRKRRIEIIGSLYGMAKHADCKHLLNKLLTTKEMIKFSDLNLSYTPKDGKKRFNGERVRISAIVNVPIEIIDFESDVTTKQGGGRYLVSFRYRSNGQMSKFFTNSDEMKSMLDAMRGTLDNTSVAVTIRSEPFQGGNGTRYYFDD